MLDHIALYDALYMLAASEGRGEALFGDCQPLAREAFRRSPLGDEFPTVWFEVPLAGVPRFDLHVAMSREGLAAGTEAAMGKDAGYSALFRWYAEEETGGMGLALAYDVSEGSIDAPAVHVNVNCAPLAHMDRFFELAVGEGDSERPGGASARPSSAWTHYRDFEAELPKGWRVWYAGYHPGRPDTPVRVDCFVDDKLKATYASVPSLLEAHLRDCGFAASSSALREVAGLIARSPFGLELQFDVLPNGTVGSTIGVSAGFNAHSASQVRSLFDDGGAAATLMERVERKGLADDRWRLIPKASFSTLVNAGGEDIALYTVPTVVKVRVREGELLDAKAYLQASACALR